MKINKRNIYRERATRVVMFEDVKVEVMYLEESNGRESYMVWKGNKSVKPDVYFYVTDKTESDIESMIKNEKYKMEKKEKAKDYKASDFYAVGDLVYDSWGYEQTNIDFYQIVGMTEKSVKLRPISKEYVSEAGFMSYYSKPVKDGFTSDEVITRKVKVYVSEYDPTCTKTAYINSKFGSISKYDGGERGCYESHYH